MSKNDYQQFAEMIKGELESIPAPLPWDDGVFSSLQKQVVISIANKTADIFAADNPNFNRSRFLVACGIRED